VLKGFRDFVLRGNVIDLAVAVVIGAAFTSIINTLVTAIINPALGALFNTASLAKSLPVTVPAIAGGHPATIYFGALVAAIIQFVLVALVVYFLLVVPINAVRKRQEAKRASGEPDDVPPTELEVLEQIRDLLATATDGSSTAARHAEPDAE
jgi:large conductance mechanosensitive channel